MTQNDMERKTPAGLPVRLLLAATSLAILAGFAETAPACDTPVYRFAMYKKEWEPWPYGVLYLHIGDEAEQDAEVNRLLKKQVEKTGKKTNIEFISIDPEKEAEEFKQMPPSIRDAWNGRKDKSQPLHVVVNNPMAMVLFAGRLQPSDVQPLIDSPARQKMAQLLASGKIIFLLLEGKNADENAKAEATVLEVAKAVREGEIEGLEPQPKGDRASDLVPLTSEDDSSTDPQAKVEVVLMKVTRSDPKEQWLVRMLMNADDYRDGEEEKPMVFGIYGRARALPPYIGGGINKRNLIYESGLKFLTGPCTCEIKGQNPGTDLLTTTDWEKAAIQMARLFGDEEGNEGLLDIFDLVPSIISDSPENDPVIVVSKDPVPPEADPTESTVRQSSDDPAPSTKQAAAAPAVTSEFGSEIALYVGIGVGGVVLLLLLGTLPFLRKNCGT